MIPGVRFRCRARADAADVLAAKLLTGDEETRPPVERAAEAPKVMATGVGKNSVGRSLHRSVSVASPSGPL